MAEEVVSGQQGGGDVEVTLRRDLGLLEVLMIGIGPNIGSTIFLLIGIGVGIAGPALLLAFCLNFAVTILTAMSYAELSSAFPETGGGYLWIKNGLFPPFGFLGGWMSWVGHCIACSVYALGFGEGVKWLLEDLGWDVPGITEAQLAKILAVLIALAFIYLNYRGVKGAGRSEIIISIILMGIIVVFIFFAAISMLTHSVDGNFEPFMPYGVISVIASMGFTFMVFEGYEVVAQTGEEAKNPEVTVPKAMFLCIIISCVLFIAVAFVSIGAVGWETLGSWGSQAIANTAAVVVPYLGASLIAFGAIIGSIAAVNSVVFSSSRVSFAMGRDGNLPRSFGRLHSRNQTPTTALFVSGAIIIAMCILLPLDKVAAVADILILLLFILVNVAALSLRKKRPDAKRYFIAPWFPYVPLIAIGAKLVIAVTLFTIEPFAWYMALAVINIGLLIHYFAKGKEEIEKVPIPEVQPLSADELERYRVMIPVDDVDSGGSVDVGALIAGKHNGEVLLVSVVEVASTVPINDVDKKTVDDRKKMLEKLKSTAEAHGVRLRARVIISHDIVTALVETAQEEKVNTIVVGWKGYSQNKKPILGRKMDQLLRSAPCDVILIKAEDEMRPQKILILSGGLWHVSKGTEIAGMIAAHSGAKVTILNVIVEDKDLDKARAYSDRLTEILRAEGVPVVTKEIRPETLLGGVIAESMEYDLMVMGSSAASRWESFDFGPIQDKIVQSAKCQVMVYKKVAAPSQADEMDD
jgi:amino acid transporter/nucleotide-binding universal stress UspA family protein